MKLTLAEASVREITNSKEKLAHELADCLWSIIVLAEQHDVDLEKAFLMTMKKLEIHLAMKTTNNKMRK